MQKRALILGSYNTAHHDWTLAALSLTDPEQQTHYVEVIGRDGPLDFSTFLTDGEPKYGSRTLAATLETSEGNRDVRKHRIADLINDLDGRKVDIRHPDYPAYFLTGRLKITVLYNDLAHAAVELSAVCDPWLYFINAQTVTLNAITAAQTVTLTNRGRRTLVPEISVTGTDPSFTVAVDGIEVTLGAGDWLLPDMQLPTGQTEIEYSGTGTAVITYREAVLR